jgi:hypothetical protein
MTIPDRDHPRPSPALTRCRRAHRVFTSAPVPSAGLKKSTCGADATADTDNGPRCEKHLAQGDYSGIARLYAPAEPAPSPTDPPLPLSDHDRRSVEITRRMMLDRARLGSTVHTAANWLTAASACAELLTGRPVAGAPDDQGTETPCAPVAPPCHKCGSPQKFLPQLVNGGKQHPHNGVLHCIKCQAMFPAVRTPAGIELFNGPTAPEAPGGEEKPAEPVLTVDEMEILWHANGGPAPCYIPLHRSRELAAKLTDAGYIQVDHFLPTDKGQTALSEDNKRCGYKTCPIHTRDWPRCTLDDGHDGDHVPEEQAAEEPPRAPSPTPAEVEALVGQAREHGFATGSAIATAAAREEGRIAGLKEAAEMLDKLTDGSRKRIRQAKLDLADERAVRDAYENGAARLWAKVER